jgi:hypothetical protein
MLVVLWLPKTPKSLHRHRRPLAARSLPTRRARSPTRVLHRQEARSRRRRRRPRSPTVVRRARRHPARTTSARVARRRARMARRATANRTRTGARYYNLVIVLLSFLFVISIPPIRPSTVLRLIRMLVYLLSSSSPCSHSFPLPLPLPLPLPVISTPHTRL